MISVARSLGACAAAFALAVPGAGMAQAGEPWTGQITLYGWGAGIGGDLSPTEAAPVLSFETSLSEVLEDLEFAFFVTGLARQGRIVLLGDLSYSASSKEELVPPGIPAEGELTQRSVTLAGGYRVVDNAENTVDLLAGVRAWRIDVAASAPLAGIDLSREKSFVDPIVAVRGNMRVAPRWSLIGYLDVGGFGVGSELTTQVAVAANYQATDNIYLSVGYRHLYLDYDDGGTTFDGSLSGPLAGVTWRF